MTGTLPHMGSGGSPVDGDAGTDAADGGFEGRIDPEIRSVLERIPRMDLSDLDLARRERRALAEEARSRQQVPVGVQTEDERVPGLPGEPEVLVRVHRRIGEVDAAAPSPVLLWVHGGGHMLGEAAQDDPLLQALVSRTGCVCVAVDWRRSPEAPYPAAMDDCYAATAWVVRSAGRLGIDPAHLVAGGASSGGGLAAGLALLIRDRGEVQLAGQVLVYPMLDDRESIASRLRVDHPRRPRVDRLPPEGRPSSTVEQRQQPDRLGVLPWRAERRRRAGIRCAQSRLGHGPPPAHLDRHRRARSLSG